MGDRWTEAQLRGELYWVLAVTWAGGTFYLSTDRLDITDGADTIEATPDLVDAPAVDEALEIWSVEAPRLSVALSFTLPVSVPELVQAGHALDGAVGELSQWAEGTAWDERRVIVRGQLVDPEYGAEWEPVTCSLEEMVADTQTTLPLDSIVIADWLAQAVSTNPAAQAVDGGSVVPMVWGTPGGGTLPGSPTPVIGAVGSTVYLGVACHYVDSFSVDIVDASGTTQTCPIYYTDIREVFGQTRGMPIVAWVVINTSTTSLNLEDPLHAIWNTGTALVDESSAAIRGLGDLLAYVFRRSALRVDWGRMDAARAVLNAYVTSGYIDEPVTLGEYVTGVLAEAFPFAMAAGPAGVYPYAWPVYPSASAAIAELDTSADPEIERESRIAYEGSDEIATHIEVRYGWNPAEETYALTRRVAGEVTTVDDIRTTIRQLAAPFARYGNRRKVLETTVVHDDATAVRVGIAQAARFGQPSRRVQYSAPRRLGWLRRGDLVTLTDAEVAASGQLCLIESVAWEETGALLFTLRYIEAGA